MSRVQARPAVLAAVEEIQKAALLKATKGQWCAPTLAPTTARAHLRVAQGSRVDDSLWVCGREGGSRASHGCSRMKESTLLTITRLSPKDRWGHPSRAIPSPAPILAVAGGVVVM